VYKGFGQHIWKIAPEILPGVVEVVSPTALANSYTNSDSQKVLLYNRGLLCNPSGIC
jgi:hypothetical protein